MPVGNPFDALMPSTSEENVGYLYFLLLNRCIA